MGSDEVPLKETDDRIGECRAGSECTYVQADLALHSPRHKSMISNVRIRVNVFVNLLLHLTSLLSNPIQSNS